jgi:hypothetical protein
LVELACAPAKEESWPGSSWLALGTSVLAMLVTLFIGQKTNQLTRTESELRRAFDQTQSDSKKLDDLLKEARDHKHQQQTALRLQRASALQPLFEAASTQADVKAALTPWNRDKVLEIARKLTVEYSKGAGLFLGDDSREVYRCVQKRLSRVADAKLADLAQHDQEAAWRAVHRCLSTLRTALIADVGARESDEKRLLKDFANRAIDELPAARLVGHLFAADRILEADPHAAWPTIQPA